MATPIYVTATTTLVQVDTTIVGGVTQDYVVILPSINAPGALITIRDIAGYASLTNRIVIETAPGISFLGSTQTRITITQPYGTITVTPRSISVWAILNTFAFPEASQAANMVNITTKNLTAEQSYLDNAIISTALISTLSTDNVFIRANLSVGQSTIAHAGFYVCSIRTLQDMLVGGVLYAGSTVSSIFANVTSTLTVPYISTQNIEIYGVLRSASTISTMGPIFAGSSISTTGNLAVGGSTFVQGELNVQKNVIFQSSLSTLYSLGVGREAMFYSSLTVKDNILTNGHLSTMSNLNVGGALSVMKTAFFTDQVSTQSNLTVGGALSVMSSFYTFGDAVLNSSLYVRSGVSTLSNVYIASSLSVGGALAVYGDIFFNDRVLDLKNLSVTQDLFVNNNISTYSSITAGLGLRIMGSTFLMGPVSTLSNMNIGGGISTMKDLAVTGVAYIQSNLVVQSTLSTVGHMNLTGFLSTLSSGSIGHNLEVGRDLMVKSSLNVLGSTMLQSSVFITGSLSVFSSVAVSCNLDVGNLLRVMELNTDVLKVSSLGVVRTDGFVLNVSSSTLHRGLFSTLGAMDVGGRISTTSELVVGSTIDAQFINVRRNLSTTGNVYVGSSIFALSNIQSGASTIVDGGLYVTNQAFLAESVRMKSLHVNETTVITGVTSINNNANILRTLTVRGGVTINNESGQQGQNLISNDTYMSSLKVSSIINYNFQSTFGQAAFYSSMQIQGHLSVFSTIAAACNADVGALLTASSIATRALQVSTMDVLQQSNFVLNVSSSTLHCGLFSTSGEIFSGRLISTTSSLAVGDNVNFYRNLTVGGNTLTDGSLQVNGFVVLSNILNVADVATLSNTLNVGSVTTLSNTLRVGEATTLSNTLDVGLATTMSNTLRVGLATTLSNTLDVGGVATMSNTLRVGNATTLSNTLDVIGATTLHGTLTVTGNIRTLGNDAVAFGNGAGITYQAATGVAIGLSAGATSQGNYGIAVGFEAGKVSQLNNAIAIGNQAGSNNQNISAVAIGNLAGRDTQGEGAVAVGPLAGFTNQTQSAVAIGNQAGYNGQNNSAVAIGAASGYSFQRESAVAIGNQAGYNGQSKSAVAIGCNAGWSSQSENAIAIGPTSGNTNQGLSAVAIGNTAGNSGQYGDAVAIGTNAGFTNQRTSAVAIGNQAGSNNQGLYSLAIGHQAGTTSQGDNAVALGLFAGKTSQAASAIAIGQWAGSNTQKINAIAIGCNAGTINQGQNSIAIGASAGAVTQVDNSIILNASGADLNAATTGLFVNPIRNTAASAYLKYNTATSEISYVPDNNTTAGASQRFIVAVAGASTRVTNDYGTSYVNGSVFGLLTTINELATNGKLIVAAGIAAGMPDVSPIAYSYDGINWLSASVPGSSIANDIIWTGTQFVAVGDAFLTSPDGINWTNITLPFPIVLNFFDPLLRGNAVAFNGHYYVIAIGTSIYTYYPLEGNDSNEIPTAFSSINKIFWTGSVWLIGGAGSYNMASFNGTTLTQLTYPSSQVSAIASDGKTIVAVGGVTVSYSTDGVTWSSGSNPFAPATAIRHVIWDGINFVAFFTGGSKIARSPNGINWIGASATALPSYNRGIAFRYSAVQTLANNGLLTTDSISTTGFVTIGDFLRVGQSTLVVQDSTRSLGVNCNAPSYQVDVNGIINAKFIYQDGAPYQPPQTTGPVSIVNLTVSTINAGTSMSVSNTTAPTRILILGQVSIGNGVYRLYTGTTPRNITLNNTSLTGSPLALNAAYYTGTSWYMGGTGTSSALLYSSADSEAWSLISPAGVFPNSSVNAIVYNGSYYLVCGTDTSTDSVVSASRSIVKSTNMNTFTEAEVALISGEYSRGFAIGAYAAAWNGTVWVAVGSDVTRTAPVSYLGTSIKYSYNGVNWLPTLNSFGGVGFLTSSIGYTVVWNGFVFVAGGEDTTCTLKYSTDGIIWYDCKGSFGLNPTKVVVWSGKRFVAVQNYSSEGTNIFYSDDGITWLTSPQSIRNGVSLIWTGSQFILGTSMPGSDPLLYVSTDGIYWAEQSPIAGYDTNLIINSLAYSSNTFPDMKIANTNFFSKQPQILGNITSTNTIQSMSNGFLINSLYSETTGRVGINNNNPQVALDVNGFAKMNNTLTPNIWVSMGNDAGNTNSYLNVSTDNGANWRQTKTFNDPNCKGLCWDGKRWLVMYYQYPTCAVITSSTGFNWTPITTTGLTTFGYAHRIIWTGTYYIAVGAPSSGALNAPIVRSLDGITWTTTLGSFATDGTGVREGRGIAYNGRMLVATGSHISNNFIIQYSLDHGYTWTPAIHPIVGVTGRCVATNGRVWVVGYDGGIVYSYDGITFVAANSATYSGYCFDIAWSGSVFVAVGQDSVASIKYSYDGINWSPTDFVTTLAFKGIGWNGTFFTTAVASTNGRYYFSRDGIEWTDQISANSSILAVRTIMFSSNVVPDLQVENLGIYGKGQVPVTSTNTIALGPSTMVLNNTVTISQSPQAALTVAGNINFTGVINSNGSPVVFTPPGINSSGNLGLSSLPSQQYNATVGEAAFVKNATFFGATTISGTLSSTPVVFAGTGTSGTFSPGIGVNAVLNNPFSCVVGQDGTIYVINRACICKITPNGVVTLLAGSLTQQGYADGQGSAAIFNELTGATLGLDGALYVADSTLIRKVTTGGLVSTVFTGTNQIIGICMDASGNIYFTETFAGFRVRKLTPAGVVSVFAGSGTQTQTDGTGVSASFYGPRGLTIDLQGNIYVADYSSVRKITPAGVVTTLAGNNPSINTIMSLQTNAVDTGANPQVVTVNMTTQNGIVYGSVLTNLIDGIQYNIGAYFNNAASPYGNYMSLPFTGGESFTIAYWFLLGNNTYYNSWSLSSTATGGSYGINADLEPVAGQLPRQRFNIRFTGGIVSPVFTVNTAEWIHVALTINSSGVCRAYKNGVFQSTATGTGTLINNSFLLLGKAGDSGRGYDGYLRKFYVFNSVISDENITALSRERPVKNIVGNSDGQGTAAGFNVINAVACDMVGNVYAADTNNYKIRQITPTGLVTTIANGVSGKNITGLNFDPTGNLFYTDSNGGCLYELPNVQRLSTNPSIQVPGTAVTLVAGSGVAGSADGLGAAATFNNPHSIYPAPDGFIYVADYGNHKIRRIDASGNVTTFAGTGVGGFANGARLSAQFNRPQDCVMDPSGNLYVVDTVNVRIRKIDASGNVTTFAGSGSTGGADGIGTAATFSEPSGITIGGDSLYVTDFRGNRIRKIVIATAAVTTLAGPSSGVSGLVDGIRGQARFYYPTQIAYGPDGFLYVATINAVRKVSMTGVVTTLAGSSTAGYLDGLGTAAQFNRPYGLAIDVLGNVFVSENTNKTIRKITPAGLVTTFLKTTYETMYRLAIDSGNLYISEFNNNKIYKLPGVAYLDPTVNIPTLSASTTTTSALIANTITNSNLFMSQTVSSKIDIARQKIPMLVALGGNDNSGPKRMIQYSTDDGLTWKTCLSGGFKNQGMNGVLYNGSIWVAAGENGGVGNIQWSTDGINWNYALSEEANSSLAIAVGWNGKMWLVSNQFGVNSTSALNTYFLQYSYDGKNWTRTNGLTSQFRTNSFAWSDSLGIWVAAGESGYGTQTTLQWSTDGLIWNNATSGGFAGAMPGAGNTGGFGVAWNGSYFIAVGAGNTVNNTILKSTDGKTWTNSMSGAFAVQGRAITWSQGHNMWIANGNNSSTTGQIKTSPNGLEWSNVGPLWPENSSAQCIVWTGTSLLTGGDNYLLGKTIWISKDGYSWFIAKSNFIQNCSAIGVGYGSETINTVATLGNTKLLGDLFVGSSNVESPGSVVTTYAGSGVGGNMNGVGTAATFQNISCVCSDTQGRIYVYERFTSGLSVRRITNSVVSTVFTLESQDSGWYSMALGNDRTIFAAIAPSSSLNTVVQKMVTTNDFSTWITTNHLTGRTNVTAMVQSIQDVSLLYYADQYGILTFNGTTHTLLAGVVATPGNTDGTSGTAARFGIIRSICIDSSETYMYILDAGNHTIRRMTLMPPYEVITYAGANGIADFADGFRLDARFNTPLGMALDSNNNIYVGDNANSRIRFIDTSTGMVYTAAGRTLGTNDGTGESARFYYPRGLTVSTDGYIYVGTTLNSVTENYVRRMSPFYPYMANVRGTVNINSAPDFRYALSVKGDVNISGNVGIGTQSPAYALDVTGTIRASGDVIASSDMRIKENIVTIDSSLEKITKMRGVYYTRKDSTQKQRQIGVIAQEVEEVLPEVVNTDTSEEKNKSVAYGNIVALLIEGIKEQQKQIEAQQSTINNLLTRV
jgi:sugar lactone lactonase YvrE